MGSDFEAWIRSRRREEVGERGANITDLLCGREESSLGVRGETEREESGVKVWAGEGGDGWWGWARGESTRAVECRLVGSLLEQNENITRQNKRNETHPRHANAHLVQEAPSVGEENTALHHQRSSPDSE